MKNLITLVYTSDLEKAPFIQECKKNGVNGIPVLDARSAVYVATGICAQNQCKVAVCVDAGNTSRSVFSGMTEAFYRNLQVFLITLGEGLDYTKELKDVVIGHYKASTYAEIQQLLSGNFPMHIELLAECPKKGKIKCEYLQQILSCTLDESTYLYVSQGIEKSAYPYKGKVVYGGMPECYEGALANVLGASLAKKHKRYIGLVSAKEFCHDINTLGNINVNDSIFYIVVGNRKDKIIEDYATAMQFEVVTAKEDEISSMQIEKMCLNAKKTVMVIYTKGE